MRNRIPTRPALFLVALLVGVPACGEVPERGAPATPVRWTASKVRATLGGLEAAVVERPARDRARIEARWTLRPGAPACAVELLLPAGVELLEGRAVAPIVTGTGRAGWLVAFPLGTTLDCVVRICGEVEAGPRVAEVPLRLGTVP